MTKHRKYQDMAGILIVDDQIGNLRLLSNILQQEGYHTRPVRDGETALLSVHADPPDLILLDIMMPELDGYTVCQALKAEVCTRDIPVIFMSALNEMFDKVKAFEVGGVDYITKPFQVGEVVARVKTHLTNRKLQQQLEAQNKRLQEGILAHEHTMSILQQRNQELALLHRISQLFNSTLDWNQVLKTILREMRQLLDITATSFWLYLPETDKLVCQQAVGPGSDTLVGWQLTMGQGVVGQTAQTGTTMIVADTRMTPHHYKEVDQKTGIEIRSILNFPFHTTGTVMGVLCLVDTTTDRFTEKDLHFVEPIATAAANAIEHARLYSLAQQEIAERARAEADLLDAHHELQATLEHLQTMQTQLLQSERMAAIGQLVSGIAHELNTPAAAIMSAIKELDRLTARLPQQLQYTLLRISDDLREQYLQAYQHVLTLRQHNVSTIERRTCARNMQHLLAEHGVEVTYNFCTQLVMAGFSATDLNEFLPLFIGVQRDDIQQSLVGSGMSQMHINNITSSIQQIVQLVHTLKQFSRVEQSELVDTRLQDDLEHTLLILRNRLHDILVHTQYDDIPLLTCYASQLNQVWAQLLLNAIQAMNEQGTLFIRLKRLEEHCIAVEIEDNGPGIPPDILPHIFNPYFTTKSRQDKNIGMGLTICQQIIEQHQGRIEVVSAMPGHTCFRVILPIAQAPQI